MPRYYSGIGSRETPPEVCTFFTTVASYLCTKGYILRSGGAPGADSAFEAGVSDPAMKQIYLPWRGFNHNPSSLYRLSNEAYQIAERYHPAWKKLSSGARKLHARNVYQIFGTADMPVSFVICWTKNGKDAGGTGEAIRIATDHQIPIFNVFYDIEKWRIQNALKNGKDLV